LVSYFSVFRHVDHFRRHSRSKSKVVRIRAEIWTFFGPPNFTGRAFQKLYERYETCIATHCLEKFHEDIPTSPEVIGAHTLNFKPNFKFSRLQFFWGTLFPAEMCASKAWSICSAYKILRAQRPLRAEIFCPEKCPLGWVNMHLYNFFVCGPKFNRFLLSNVGGVAVDQLCLRFFDVPTLLGIFAIKVESCQKSRRNLDVFWPSKF